MVRHAGKRVIVFGILVVVLAVDLVAWLPAEVAEPKPQAMKSGVVSFEAAKADQADWGEMRRYFTGETSGTKDVLTAVAIVKPGKAVHRAHRHAQEEYLVLAEGSGTWSLAGKEFPANRGDILYAEPWVYHGITNTGTEQLIFMVVRFNSKGIPLPPRPDSQPDEQ
jgi:mannose-6-phosphate isomerase-like protein (cupin superfamily)